MKINFRYKNTITDPRGQILELIQEPLEINKIGNIHLTFLNDKTFDLSFDEWNYILQLALIGLSLQELG